MKCSVQLTVIDHLFLIDCLQLLQVLPHMQTSTTMIFHWHLRRGTTDYWVAKLC